jgi:5S rRNA maturation endonuclease (ribonuclease M5)
MCAVLCLDFVSFAKPSALVGDRFVCDIIEKFKPQHGVVIMADSDSTGMRGAQRLQSRIPGSRVLHSGITKDIRGKVENVGPAQVKAEILDALSIGEVNDKED